MLSLRGVYCRVEGVKGFGNEFRIPEVALKVGWVAGFGSSTSRV